MYEIVQRLISIIRSNLDFKKKIKRNEKITISENVDVILFIIFEMLVANPNELI